MRTKQADIQRRVPGLLRAAAHYCDPHYPALSKSLAGDSPDLETLLLRAALR